MDYKINNNLLQILNYNLKCYEFKSIKFKNGLFDETVDATYIINLVGNDRYNNIINQINEYNPTRQVYILLNQGFKKCNKTKNIVYPANDLIDAFLQIFRHANDKKYENILILEDDFIFNKKIKNKKHINSINKFLKKKQGEDFIYYLGCIPFLMLPNISNLKHFSHILSVGTHSVIYSKKMRQNMMNNYRDIIYKYKDWDLNVNNQKDKYVYYKCLCYQLFTETENSKYWNISHPILHFFAKIFINLIKILKLNKQVEPGYSILYTISQSIIFILAIILIAIIVINSRKNKKI